MLVSLLVRVSATGLPSPLSPLSLSSQPLLLPLPAPPLDHHHLPTSLSLSLPITPLISTPLPLPTAVMILLFVYLLIRAPATPWGDVSQALIYHQVNTPVIY